MMIYSYDIEKIEAEIYADAEGIIDKGDTNEGLGRRDYSVKCRMSHKIMILKGFWMWWCSAHYQPHMWCERAQFIERGREFAQQVLDTDRTPAYEYGASNNAYEIPGKGSRWATPSEIAKTFLRNFKR